METGGTCLWNAHGNEQVPAVEDSSTPAGLCKSSGTLSSVRALVWKRSVAGMPYSVESPPGTKEGGWTLST